MYFLILNLRHQSLGLNRSDSQFNARSGLSILYSFLMVGSVQSLNLRKSMAISHRN